MASLKQFWRSGHILAAVLAAYPAAAAHIGAARNGYPDNFSPNPRFSMRQLVGARPCAAQPIGEMIVATLHNAPIVTLQANGHPVVLLLDTGAEKTILTPSAAERIGAKAPRIEFPRSMRGIAGTVPGREVELNSLIAAGIPIAWRRVVVAPITTPRMLTTPLDGVLGADVLSGFELDLDLPGNRARLFGKGACADGPPWLGPYSAIETGRSLDGHLFFPVQLDGRRVVAIIDTGAQHSVLSEAAARALGVTDSMLARDRPLTLQGATAEKVNSYLHKFVELKLGAEVIANPELVVGNINVRDADIIFGVDFLRSRRLWFSYDSFKVFISRR